MRTLATIAGVMFALSLTGLPTAAAALVWALIFKLQSGGMTP